MNLHSYIINSNPFNYAIEIDNVSEDKIREIYLRDVGFEHTLEIYSKYRDYAKPLILFFLIK